MASTPLTISSLGPLSPLAFSAFFIPFGIVLFIFVAIFLTFAVCLPLFLRGRQRCGRYRSPRGGEGDGDDIYNTAYYDADSPEHGADIPLYRAREWAAAGPFVGERALVWRRWVGA
ncbi:hypothetical protein MMC34_001135 [Xylographa carneopallida]|nr:hypothetical protein [Xylographa carneopallida]